MDLAFGLAPAARRTEQYVASWAAQATISGVIPSESGISMKDCTSSRCSNSAITLDALAATAAYKGVQEFVKAFIEGEAP